MVDRRQFLAGAALAGVSVSGRADQSRSETKLFSGSAWEIGEKGGFDTMRRVDRVFAEPGAGEVLIRVRYSAVAGRDRAIAAGWFLEDKPPELIPLSEGVGDVVAVGAGVSRIRVGDRVVSAHFARWVDGPWRSTNYAYDVGNTVDGWLAEHINLPAAGLAVVPDNVSDVTAATLSGSGVTAWNGLFECAHVQAGDLVLSLGTGGVSSWSVLLARMAGARVAVTSSSDEKLEAMRALGATYTVNYRKSPDWGAALLRETGGRGADIVMENVGRLTLDQSMIAAEENGFVVMVGTGPLPDSLPKMPGWYQKNVTLKAISNGSRAMLESMLRAIADNNVEALIAREFDFRDAPDALTALAAGEHVGKIVIRHPAARRP